MAYVLCPSSLCSSVKCCSCCKDTSINIGADTYRRRIYGFFINCKQRYIWPLIPYYRFTSECLEIVFYNNSSCSFLYNSLIYTMKVVLLLAIVASILIPSLLPGLKAKELIDPDSGQFTQTLYQDILKELNGAHLRIAATHVRSDLVAYYSLNSFFLLTKQSIDVV